jgi:transketolase
MRDAFVRRLTELAADDERVFLLTADLGIDLFDELARRASGRMLNVGIAEQAMVGVAAGLAYAGKVPFAYSIAPFVTSRVHDQVRVDVALTSANVKLVGVGGGVSYGYLGPTHHAIDDVAIMRALPNMTVLTPADPLDAAQATEAALAHPGPVYLRLGKNGERSTLPENGRFEIGRARWLRPGADVALLSSGTALPVALAAAEALDAAGISAALAHFGSVKPLDEDAVALAARRSALVVTVEEASIVGGFGSAAAEVLAERGAATPLVRVGLDDVFAEGVGSREHLLAEHGITAEAIASRVTRALRRAA